MKTIEIEKDVVENILEKYSKIGVEFTLNENDLKFKAPKGVVNELVLSDIKNNKFAIIEAIESHESRLKILKVENKELYKLSSSQYGIWTQTFMNSGKKAYNMLSSYSIKGAISIDLLEQSFKGIIEKNEILRTNIVLRDNGVYQKIKPRDSFDFNIEVIHLNEDLSSLTKKYVDHVFDLESDLLFKVVAFKESQELIHLVIIVHHIIVDGVSIGLIFNELFNNYRKLAEGRTLNFTDDQIQYRDFAEWEQKMLENGNFDKHKKFWLDNFNGDLEPINLPGHRPRPNIKTYSGSSFKKKISGKNVERFIDIGRENGVSFFHSFITLLNVLLSKYTGQKDLTIGAPFSLRNSKQLENELGVYISTYPIRTIISDDDTYNSLLLKVSEFVNHAMDNNGYSFHKLVDDLDLVRDVSRHPLFDIFVSSLDGVNSNLRWEGLEIKENDVYDNTSKFDLEFYVEGGKDEIDLLVYYNTDIYNHEFVNQLTVHLENLMVKISEEQIKLSNFDVLNRNEKELILKDFNNSRAANEGNILSTIDTYYNFDKIAVFDDNDKLSYQDLEKLTNTIAANLDNVLTNDQKYVAVSIPRSAMLVPLILGILKSGRVYVPLDPIFPKGRITQLMNTFGIDMLVSDKLWEGDGFSSILISNLLNEDNVREIVYKEISNSSPAYLIFTSGTTGLPKGVEVSHKSLNNFIESMKSLPKIEREDVLLSVTTYSFDISLLELLGPLCSGASVYVAKEHEIKDPNIWVNLCKKIDPTIIQATPSFYQMLFNFGWEPSASIKLLSGGEPISRSLSSKMLNSLGGYWNMYGPTETTIWSTIKWVTSPEEANTIGKPINNTKVFILDHNLNPLPLGVIGDIYIGGDGLALGYKDNEELTRDRFIRSPFNIDEYLYFTGDLGKWNSNGEIKFIGRKDYQIKFRGYRIELGEIEHYITKFSEEISKAVVISLKNVENEVLKAFYTSNSESLDESALEEYLRSILPFYMVPSQFIKVDNFELTPNGKIDRKKLLNIESKVDAIVINEDLTEIEKKIQLLWSEILGLENISIDSNFFQLGGNSLNIAQFINTIQKTYGFSISYKVFIESPTIRLISERISRSNEEINDFIKIPRAEPKEFYELTKSQYRIWLTSKLGGSKAYNIQTTYVVNSKIDRKAFELSLSQILERHDSMRTVFKLNKENRVNQYIIPYNQYNLEYLYEENLNEDEIQKILEKEFDIEFNLEEGPLFKAGLLGTEEGSWVIYLAFHHIISDGWSLEVFLKELLENYQHIEEYGEKLERKELDIQFHDYSVWFNNDLNNELLNQKKFWHKTFERPVDLIKFPFEKPERPTKKTYNGDLIIGQLDLEKANKLKAISKELNVTTFSTLLSVFNLLIYKYTGVTNVTTGTPISGRINQQLEAQLGLYINTLPIRTGFDTNRNFDVLNDEQNNLLFGFYDNQMYQMDNIIEELNLKAVPGRSPLFDTMIVYQNQTETALFAKGDEEEKYGIDSLESNVNFYAQFDLSISFSYNPKEGLNISLFFNTDVFEKGHMEKLVEDYCYLMDYRLRNRNLSPDICFNDNSYSFLNDKEIVFQPIEKTRSEEEILIDDVVEDNEIKNLLKQVFLEYLDSDIRYHEDYFELGGSSLQAINLINEINRRFDTNLSIVDFYGNSSINKLYSILFDGEVLEEENKFSIIEPLSRNISEGKDLIIFFPPVVGIGKFFLSIANQIDDRYNCYAFNVPVFADEMSLESKAAMFFEEAQDLIKNHVGKIVLFGYSTGVNFTYEFAKLLSKDSDVQLLLVDRGSQIRKVVVTRRFIKRVITSQESLIKSLAQFSSTEDTYLRIEETIRSLNDYTISGKLDLPIYTFECEDNEDHGYMKLWEDYTHFFKGVNYLKGNHSQIFEKENLLFFTNFLNNL